MNTFNLARPLEQEQKIDYHSRPFELLFEGEFDGATGLLEPRYPHDEHYWQGYCEGLKEYWRNKKPFVKAIAFK